MLTKLVSLVEVAHLALVITEGALESILLESVAEDLDIFIAHVRRQAARRNIVSQKRLLQSIAWADNIAEQGRLVLCICDCNSGFMLQ